MLVFFSRIAILGAMLIALLPIEARAAELVMFEKAGCPWCETFDREVGAIYPKTEEALRAPLRRVDIDAALPSDLAFIQVERLTPLFVLVDKGREIGRIRGYGGQDAFWTQLFMLMEKLDAVRKDTQRAPRSERSSRANG
jgi:thioredoxin-related protein